MERIRTLLAAIVSTVLTLGFLGCVLLTMQGKGQAYYQGIVTPATTMLFLVLTVGIVILAILPEKKDERAKEPLPQTFSGEVPSAQASSSSSQFRAVVEVPVEEE